MPADRIFAFARDRRRFIVSGATRKARAISSLLSPPGARSVSATKALGRERWMAAGEDQLEPLVGDRRLVHRVVHGVGHVDVEQAGLLREGALAPQAVDRPVAGGRHEPDARGGGPRRRAASARRRSRTPLGGVLGVVEIAEDASHRPTTRRPAGASMPAMPSTLRTLRRALPVLLLALLVAVPAAVAARRLHVTGPQGVRVGHGALPDHGLQAARADHGRPRATIKRGGNCCGIDVITKARADVNGEAILHWH
jgi:hypothetical protein